MLTVDSIPSIIESELTFDLYCNNKQKKMVEWMKPYRASICLQKYTFFQTFRKSVLSGGEVKVKLISSDGQLSFYLPVKRM